MRVSTNITELDSLHPRLLWDDIGAALAAVLRGDKTPKPIKVELAAFNLPVFGSGLIDLEIAIGDVPESHLSALRRTYETSRLVELAAIAVAVFGLYYGGGHEIRDVALRGSGADYLVDDANHLLEIAGRSRRNDFDATWQRKWSRLSEELRNGYYICVVEFETRTGRLEFYN